MKFLIDENFSPRLAAALSDLYPESRHVEECGLISVTDEEIWRFAGRHGFAILTKDSESGPVQAGSEEYRRNGPVTGHGFKAIP